MKPVNFKKWIGVAVISFILTFVFGIIGAISSGTTMLGMMYTTGTDMGQYIATNNMNGIIGDNFWNNNDSMMNDDDNDMMDNDDNDMMNDDNGSMMSGNWSFGFGDKEKSTCTFSIDRSQGSEAGDVNGSCTTTTKESNNK